MFREPIHDEPELDPPAGTTYCEHCGAIVPEAYADRWPVPHGDGWETETVCHTCRPPRPRRPDGYVLHKLVVSISTPWDTDPDEIAPLARALMDAVGESPFHLEAVWLQR